MHVNTAVLNYCVPFFGPAPQRLGWPSLRDGWGIVPGGDVLKSPVNVELIASNTILIS